MIRGTQRKLFFRLLERESGKLQDFENFTTIDQLSYHCTDQLKVSQMQTESSR